jgi:hypothetical protein
MEFAVRSYAAEVCRLGTSLNVWGPSGPPAIVGQPERVVGAAFQAVLHSPGSPGPGLDRGAVFEWA